MDSFENLRSFLGWCTLINIGLLIFSSLMIVTLRERISRIHGRMFGISESEVSRAYFQYLATFKVMVIVFNLVPYLALRIMA